MSDNKQLARQWFDEVWNNRSGEAVSRMMAPGCTVHGLGQVSPDLLGPDGFRPFHQAFLSAFPDLHVHVEDLLEEGDRVAVRWIATGRHGGEGLGFPATNRKMRVQGITIARIQNGQLVEGWNNFDVLGMLQQLGAAPSPAGDW